MSRVQLTKIKAVVSLKRVSGRYFNLMSRIDTRAIHLYVGGKFLLRSDDGEIKQVTIPIDKIEDYLLCTLTESGIIYSEVVWSQGVDSKSFDTEDFTVIPDVKKREATYFFGFEL